MAKKVNSVINDPVDYVTWWYEKQLKASTAPEAITFDDVWVDYIMDHRRAGGFKSFKQGDLKSAWTIVMRKAKLDRLRSVLTSLKTVTAEDLEPLQAWIKAVTGASREADTVAMAHWIASVKRLGFDQDVRYHLFISVKGKQGSGKSTAIMKLTHPLKAVRLTMNADEVGDPNTFKEMSYNAVIFLDELASMHKADKEKIKKQLTTSSNSYRPFYSQERVEVPRRASYIGGSNNHIAEIFNDPTGMRRFYQLEAQDRIDWDAINAIDYVQLWQGVDENKDYFTEQHLPLLDKVQQSYVNKSDVEEFLDQYNLSSNANEDKRYVALDLLFQEYLKHSKSSGCIYQKTKSGFKRALESRGFLSAEGRHGTTRSRIITILVNADCALDFLPKSVPN